MESVGDQLADMISAIKDMKTVAYVDDRATGVAALLPLACRDIVLKKGARMGDVRQTLSGRNGQVHDLSDVVRTSLANKAAFWAREKGHPEAVAVAMVDPDAEIVEARDSQTGASKLLLRSQVDARPGPLPGDPNSQGSRVGPDDPRRGRGVLRTGSGRQRQRRAQTALRTAGP